MCNPSPHYVLAKLVGVMPVDSVLVPDNFPFREGYEPLCKVLASSSLQIRLKSVDYTR